MGLKDLSNCAKGAIACGVCSAVIAAVMIPVGILVIAPNMGQHALNVAVMDIPESTVFNIPNPLHHNSIADMFNSVKLDQTALPLYAKLHETDMVMNIPAAPTDPNDPASWMSYQQNNLAWFRMPEQGVKHGENDFSFTVNLTIMEPDAMVQWTFSLGLGGFPNGTDVFIVGEPKLTALGMITMKLKMGKRLHCYYVTPPTPTTTAGPPTTAAPPTTTAAATTTAGNSSASSTTLAPSSTTLAQRFEEIDITERRLVGVGPVTLTCTDMGELDNDLIDEILTNFTRDRAIPATTTTTAAAALV